MNEEGGLKKKLFVAAVETARKRRLLAEEGKFDAWTDRKFAFLDRLVFEKIRQRFGGCLKGALTASATMNPEIARFFFDIGIPVYDCYGLTETSPACTMNCPARYRLGSVGQPVERVKIVIDRSAVQKEATDGEIVIYGPNVMQGYHNKPEETAAVMTEDGGFRTGDRGWLDDDGYLFITGRIKEQYKLENGKYVFPAAIEEEIKLLPLVANAMVYGDGRPYNICLVYPDFAVLKRTASELGLSDELENLINTKAVHDLISSEIVKHLGGKYGGYEIPKKFFFLTEDFTLENGMLTQTMKTKRSVVIDRYKKEIEAQYA